MERRVCAVVFVLAGSLLTFTRGRADAPRRRGPTPSPGITMSLPPPLVYDKAADAPAPVRFRHSTHVKGVRNECLSCHPQPFRMLRPERKAAHVQMDAGLGCGTCHDGRRAFATSDGERCDRCHTGEAGR